jgi:hypothetical protein
MIGGIREDQIDRARRELFENLDTVSLDQRPAGTAFGGSGEVIPLMEIQSSCHGF